MDELKALFSSQLCKLRKQQNLTQEQISELLSISPRCFQKDVYKRQSPFRLYYNTIFQ